MTIFMKNSTELIRAVNRDYEMLKKNGKHGEGEIHMYGYLHGYVEGASDNIEVVIDKACKWIGNLMLAGGYNEIDRKTNIDDFRKYMKTYGTIHH